ncbi:MULTISPECIES: hypothetical protein [unclassified Paenibacillus]|uniref:hypothetical protein n=1 Tax=unclassified Paenibacillus TaxID=185978 RepID=UPI001AE9B0C4|nr:MULTISPECIES: hypothetical protein [unclassified Paenibacillus]MBP1154263.1 hypothetical protein [Paenibacillus sp. PvP091]MBP1170352.1 hypothetical protein [Paenibacillus sp. PvR098]MBP2441380.1 hypothetical protein [Paenibacillus sp. PvP052]
MRERRIGRAFWGVQRKSFKATVSYLKQKHDQVNMNLNKKLDEVKTENDQIQQQLTWFQAADSGTSMLNSPKPNIQVEPVEPSILPRNQQYDFKIQWKKRLFGLNEKQAMAYIHDLFKMQDKELQQIYEEMNRLLEARETLRIKLAPYQTVVHRATEAASAIEIPVEVSKSAVEDEIKERLLLEIKETLIQSILKESILKESILLESRKLILEERQETRKELPAKVVSIHHMKPKVSAVERTVPSMQVKVSGPEMVAPPIQPQTSVTESAALPLKPRASVPMMAAPQKKQRMTVGGNSFWEEDIEQLLFEPHSWASHPMAYEMYYPSPERTEEAFHSPAHEHHIETGKSQAVTDHTYELRKRYIVGKIAGADLKDNSGGWIIVKNAVITEEVLNRAEQEGKLAELIVNMVIRGLGE